MSVQKLKILIQPVFVLLVGLFLLLCSTGTVSAHHNQNAQDSAACGAACHSAGQTAATNSVNNKTEEDDKEPTPFVKIWLQIPVNLLLLYTLPALSVLLLVYNERDKLLGTQLRL